MLIFFIFCLRLIHINSKILNILVMSIVLLLIRIVSLILLIWILSNCLLNSWINTMRIRFCMSRGSFALLLLKQLLLNQLVVARVDQPRIILLIKIVYVDCLNWFIFNLLIHSNWFRISSTLFHFIILNFCVFNKLLCN